MSFDKIAVLNGHFRPVREVRLNPTSSGILSGWATYTSVRFYDGFPFNVDAHLTRLRKDAARMSIPLPLAIENLRPDLTDLARRNHVENGRARVMLLGGTDEAGKTASNLLLLTSALLDRPVAESIWIAPFRLHTSSPLTGVKLTANTLYVYARREAQKNRFDDVLLLNEADHVVEVSSGNVFWGRGGELFTPNVECGCLDGTSRGLVRRLAKKLGIPLTEGSFGLQQVLEADEVFIASVSREISPVSCIGDQTYADGLGPLGSRLHQAFRDRVDAWLEEMHAEAAAMDPDAE